MIVERLRQVRERVERAAEKAGRDPRGITLLAVSKIKPASDIVAAYQAGQRDFGESYVQEFREKSVELGDLPGARFHMIGKLQSNKSSLAGTLFDAIQTVDSVKLARRLGRCDRLLDVFIEVKLSKEDAKSGVEPERIEEVAAAVRECSNLKLRGLMTMPPWTDDPEASRPYFQRLRELAQVHSLEELSMGMSRDLEIAVEEGSTMVRVGTAIFGPRTRKT